MLITAEQPWSPRREGAGETGVRARGREAEWARWAGHTVDKKPSPSPLGHRPDLQTKHPEHKFVPPYQLLSSAAAATDFCSVSASCLFLTVAFLSNFCVRREEAEGPGAGRGRMAWWLLED